MIKKFFLVGSLVVLSLGAMFLSCSKDDDNSGSSPANGCECTFKYSHGQESLTPQKFSLQDMKQLYNSSTSGICLFVFLPVLSELHWKCQSI